ncbi:MAG: GNAT family N-acetyltransferase [Candidatus Altiarchaeota archaeon]
MNVRVAGLHDVEKWNDFAQENSGSVFHAFEWGDVIEHAFDYRRVYLIAEDDGGVAGILPFFYLKGFFSGRRLVSLPVSDVGGPVGTKEAVHELFESAQQLMVDFCADYVEVKSLVREEDYVPGREYVTFKLTLPSSEDELLGVIGKKNRNLVRKAEKEGVTVEEVKDASGVDEFYGAYSKTMKDLGTPPYPKKFYGYIQKILTAKNKAKILLAKKGDDTVGGAVFLKFGETTYYFTGVSPYKYRNYASNTLLVYAGLAQSVKEKSSVFDFGRTQTQGVYNFKRDWGGKEEKMIYCYKLLDPEKKIPGGKIQKLTPLWRKLVPLKIANTIGPQIRRNFGF